MSRPFPPRLRPTTLCLGSTILLGVTVLAASAALNPLPPVNGDTPLQVAETLDRLVQPRFQQNAGRFGMSRVVSFDGHENAYQMDAQSPGERRLLRRIYGSHRSVVVAFLHCRHKPGAHVDPKMPPQAQAADFRPSVDALAVIGATQSGADHNFDWAGKNLTRVALPSLPVLRRGQGRAVSYQNWLVVMRPVRATHAACVGCHEGARLGDTLGVMVYAVDKNRKIGSRNYDAPGGE